jgi:hypothetical protein
LEGELWGLLRATLVEARSAATIQQNVATAAAAVDQARAASSHASAAGDPAAAAIGGSQLTLLGSASAVSGLRGTARAAAGDRITIWPQPR